jgi:hypothetical protein
VIVEDQSWLDAEPFYARPANQIENYFAKDATSCPDHRRRYLQRIRYRPRRGKFEVTSVAQRAYCDATTRHLHSVSPELPWCQIGLVCPKEIVAVEALCERRAFLWPVKPPKFKDK